MTNHANQQQASSHHNEQWSVHSNGQGKVQVELTDSNGRISRLLLSVGQASELMDAIGRASKKARAESQEG